MTADEVQRASPASTLQPLPLITPLPAASDPAFERFVRLVRRQLGVPVALVSLVDAQEQVFPGAAGLPEPYASTRRTPLSHSFCQHVVAAAEPLVVEDAHEHPLVRDNLAIRDLAVVAYAGMPLVDADGMVVGSLCAIHDRPHRWSDDELAVLADLADACSSELQLRTMRDRADQAARRAAEQWQRTRELLVERSGVAETLQRAMLTRLPRTEHLGLAARYVPAHAGNAVGGDWYDAFTTPDGALVVAVGDISGHDVTAAAGMGQLRTLLRGYAVDRDEPPSETVRRLDRAMETLSVETLATVVLGRIERRPDGAQVLRWTNAGHPPPLLLFPDGRVDVLEARPELLVGVRPETRRTDHLVTLPAGSTLLLYSDGLIEQRAGGWDIDSGTTALVESLTGQAQLPLDELLDRVLERVVADRDDDIVVLAVRSGPLD